MLEVVFDPPTPTGVAAMGDRLRSPPSEHLYGLTERLRDSPVIAAGVVDIPMDDIAPPEVGSLERRGETVEMRVLPTFSIYAPFFQSSRGYGLAVAGTTFGLFDLAKSDARTVSFRFETGTTAESRRLLFHFFVGPEYETILDEYTSLVGRPIVPPDWAFLHWRWRDTLDVGPPALLDGTTVNAEVADRPELVNDAPYASGWLIKVRPDDPADVDNLLTAEQYADQLAKSRFMLHAADQ